MSSFSFGRSTPVSPDTGANVRISRDGSGQPGTINLTETHVCQIVHSLAESDITPLRWNDNQFAHGKAAFLETITNDLQLRNNLNSTQLSSLIDRLLTIFAHSSLLQVKLSKNGTPALVWPKRVVDAETLRDIGIWLREVGLDGFNPAQLIGPRGEDYLNTIVESILQKRPLGPADGNGSSSDRGVTNIPTNSTEPTPRDSRTPRNHSGQAPLMSGAIRQMHDMDSRLVRNEIHHPHQQPTPDLSPTQPRHDSQTPWFRVASGPAGSPRFNETGMPNFTRPFAASSPSSAQNSSRPPGATLPDEINDALHELAVLGSQIYSTNGVSPQSQNATMDRYRQLSRFISQVEVSGTVEKEPGQEDADVRIPSNGEGIHGNRG